jgi:hypothetical protein
MQGKDRKHSTLRGRAWTGGAMRGWVRHCMAMQGCARRGLKTFGLERQRLAMPGAVRHGRARRGN